MARRYRAGLGACCDRQLAHWSPGVFMRYNGKEKEEAMPKRRASQHVPKDV